jgi:hypothetical protein
MVTVAFFKSTKKSWFAALFERGVRWWTSGPYSHTELVFKHGDEYVWASSEGKTGVRLKVDAAPDPALWDLVEVPYSPDTATSWFLQHEGCKYDYLGLFGFVVRKVKGENSRYFCSEAVAAALGIPDSWRFDPNTLYAALNVPR